MRLFQASIKFILIKDIYWPERLTLLLVRICVMHSNVPLMPVVNKKKKIS